MDERIDDILCKLRDGKINVNETLNKIDKITYQAPGKDPAIKYAKKIKIYINAIDDENTGKHFKLSLPAISLKFIKRLGTFGLKMAIKHNISDNSKLSSNDLDKIKYLLDALTLLPPFEIVNIDSKDAKIHIYTC